MPLNLSVQVVNCHAGSDAFIAESEIMVTVDLAVEFTFFDYLAAVEA